LSLSSIRSLTSRNTTWNTKYVFVFLIPHNIICFKREILSIAVSTTNLIASGEYGNKPAIHIWDYNKMKSINIIKGIHDNGVLYMEFFNDNEFLATCSWRNKAQVIVYNINDSSIVLSVYVKGFAVDLLTISNYVVDFAMPGNRVCLKLMLFIILSRLRL